MGPVRAKILRWPSQSPDGRWIAFEAFGRVWLQEIAGGKTVGAPRRLTKDDPALPRREYAPTFCADGRSIAYVSWSDAEGGHIWKAPAAPGASPVRVTKAAGHYANPVWSPKGDRLAVLRGSGLEFRGRQPEDEEFFEIVLVDAADRRCEARHDREAGADLQVPSPGLLELRRDAALLPRSDRAEEADRRPEERPRLDPARRHGPPPAPALSRRRRHRPLARRRLGRLHLARQRLRDRASGRPY